MVSTAPLVAVYTTVPGGTMLVGVEAILMMLPPSGPNCATASFVASSMPNTLVAKWRSQCAPVSAGAGEDLETPAVLAHQTSPRQDFVGSSHRGFRAAGCDADRGRPE